MLFEIDKDYGLAEKIVDRVLSMTAENGTLILPSTKNVRSQKCYSNACDMLWAIYDGTFLKNYHFDERSDYNMVGWKEKVESCEDDWSKVRSLVIGSVKNFYRSLFPEYSPQNKKFLKTIKFSNFFITSLNQSMFVNCINEPLTSGEFLRNRKVEGIMSNIPERYRDVTKSFHDRFIVDSKHDSVYWKGVSDICNWWKLFTKYTPFGFDVKGNLRDGNIVSDFCSYILEYMERSKRDCNPYWFAIYDETESYICDGFFRSYLSGDKFSVARELPQKLWTYGNETKFKALVRVEKKTKINVEDEQSFIDSLED